MDSRIIKTYVLSQPDAPAEAETALQQTLARLQTGDTSLLSIVQSLGDYLTSEEPTTRAKGTTLLSSVLSHCSQEQLTQNATNVLVQFYCDRLHDQLSVPELLKGILSLLVSKNFTETHACAVSKALIEHVHVQTYQQVTRFIAFQIFEGLLNGHMPAIKPMGNEFVFGYIQSMDGEKDPRNLLLAFRLVKLIIESFDITQHVEDLFDVVFCYFPITFKPPPDDPYGITPEDLKLGLRACIAATPLFARFATPLLLEKLTASSGAAKRDAADTLSACAPVYGAKEFGKHVETCWNTLKEEVYSSADSALGESAFRALGSLTRTLSASVSSTTSDGGLNPLEQMLKLATDESLMIIKNAESKLIIPAAKTLHAVASVSDPACHAICKAVLPIVIMQFEQSKVSSYRNALLQVLIALLDASRVLYTPKASSDSDISFSPLLQYKDNLFGLFSSALNNTEEYDRFRLSGLIGLRTLCLHPAYLSVDEIGVGVQNFVEASLLDADQEVRMAAISAMESLVPLFSSVLVNIAIPALLRELPDDPSIIPHDVVDRPKSSLLQQRALDAIVLLAIEKDAFAAMLPILIHRLELFARSAGDHQGYARLLLRSLTNLIRAKSSKKDQSDIVDNGEVLVRRLLQLCLSASMDKESHENVMLEISGIDQTAVIIGTVMQNLEELGQIQLLENIFDVFLNGKYTWLAGLPISTTEALTNKGFAPLKPTSPNRQTNLSTIFASSVGSIRRLTPLPVEDLSTFLLNMITFALHAENVVLQRSLAITISSIMNKWDNDDALTTFVETIIKKHIVAGMEDASAKVEIRESSLMIFIWALKGLALRSHLLGLAFGTQLASMLSSNERHLARRAAEGFGIILSEIEEGPLSRSSYANIKLLNRQRFFNYCMPLLVKGFNDSSEATESTHHHLTALSHLLGNIPRPVLLNELPPLLPLLLHSLSVPDPELRSATVKTFEIAAAEAPKVISEHISTLIPRLLPLTHPDNINIIKVRVSALRCLTRIPDTVRYDQLHPYKQSVIRDLLKSLDDPKRVVRQKAVVCRNRWFRLNGQIEL